MTKSTLVSLSQAIWPVVLILLLAAGLRIINAGHFGVWTDEGWSTWAASDHHFGVIIDNVLAKDRHPPLFELALSGWWTIAGDSRIALRFLAIAGGLLTVAALYRLVADIFGRKAALYGTLLLSILPGAIYYSQEIRDYGWLTLSATLMSLCFLRFLKRPGRLAWCGYVLSTVFMLYTLYIGGLLLLIHGAVGLLLWRTSNRHKLALVSAWVVSVLLYVPWLLLLPKQLSFIGTGITPWPTSWAGFIASAGVVLGGQLALAAGLYALGLWRVIEQRANTVRWLTQLTVVFSGLGLYGLMFVANLKFGLLAARTIVFLAPMLMAVCGYGLSLLEGRARNLLAIALFIVLPATTAPIQPRLDYATAAQTVAADYMPGDLIILENGWDDNAFRYELLLALGEPAEPDIVRTLPWVDNRDLAQPVLPQVEPWLKTHRRVWIINWLQPSQLIDVLARGGFGFQPILKRETSTGSQYQSLYADQTVREILFERPPAGDSTPIARFGDGIFLNDALLPIAASAGQRVQLDLWWSATTPVPHDYSVSVFIMDSAGAVRAQSDQPPSSAGGQWPVESLIFDRHTINLPTDLAAGTYQIGVDVYWYGDGQRLPISNLRNGLTSANAYAIIGQAQITR